MDNASLKVMLSAGPSVLRHAAKCSLAADRGHYTVEASWGCQLGSAQVRLKGVDLRRTHLIPLG